MRYRRVGYRYTMVIHTEQPRPLGAGYAVLLPRPDAYRIRLAQPHWRPATDVYETEREIVVTLELAGLDQDRVEILLFEDALVVEGERRLPPAQERGVYHSAEIRQGRFRVEVVLPASVDGEGMAWRYDDGLLRVTLPKLTEAPR